MYHDSLTGLLNHTSSKSALDRALADAEREGKPLSVIMLDIDFSRRSTTTTAIRSATDHPLAGVAAETAAAQERYSRPLRRRGILVGLIGATADQALQTMDKIRRDFHQILHPYRDTPFRCSFSGGIASFPDYIEREELVLRADEALYRAKRGGRNQLVIAHPCRPGAGAASSQEFPPHRQGASGRHCAPPDSDQTRFRQETHGID